MLHREQGALCSLSDLCVVLHVEVYMLCILPGTTQEDTVGKTYLKVLSLTEEVTYV